MTWPVQMCLIALRVSIIESAVTLTWVASALKHLNVPQFEARICQPFRGKSTSVRGNLHSGAVWLLVRTSVAQKISRQPDKSGNCYPKNG